MNESRKNPAAVALGKLGGSKASEAQKQAARDNGKKGGRPNGSKTKKWKGVRKF